MYSFVGLAARYRRRIACLVLLMSLIASSMAQGPFAGDEDSPEYSSFGSELDNLNEQWNEQWNENLQQIYDLDEKSFGPEHLEEKSFGPEHLEEKSFGPGHVIVRAERQVEGDEYSKSIFSSSNSETDLYDTLPCSYLGTIYLDQERWKGRGDCLFCVCNNSTVSCDIHACQPLTCKDQIWTPGVCCPKCPFNTFVTEVTPKYPKGTEIVEFNQNELVLSINITYLDIVDVTTDIRGKGLWSMSLFASNNPRGEGDPISLLKKAITTAEHIDLDLIQGEIFRFEEVEYTLNMDDVRCDQVSHICATLGQGKKPKPGFGLEGDPDETALTGCTKAPKCIGVVIRGLHWEYSASSVIAGMRNPLKITSTATFTSNSRQVSGTNLWRLAMYGAKNEEGTGERFQYHEQTITAAEVSKPLTGETLEFELAEANFDIAAIGCIPEFEWVCMDFTKNDAANPDFPFESLGEDDGIKTLCNISPCRAVTTIVSLETEKQSGAVVDNRAVNNYVMSMDALTSGVGVAGDNSWEVTSFGSSLPSGGGTQFSATTQVLTEEQQGTLLPLGEPMQLSNIEFNIDMTGLTCADVQYVCLRYGKNEAASTVFTLRAFPDERLLTSCVAAACDGVFPETLEWSYLTETITLGQQNMMSVNAEVTFDQISRELDGSGFWKLNIFGSKNKNGNGKRFDEKTQIATQDLQATPLVRGESVLFSDMETTMDLGTIGCTEVKFICVEFMKGDRPRPDYVMVIEEGNSLINCKLTECNIEINLSNLQTDIQAGTIVDERPRNPYEIDVSFEGEPYGVFGQNLWQLTAFGSRNADGSGTQFSKLSQVLTNPQSSMTLDPAEPVEFGIVGFNFDMSELSCSDVRFLCLRLTKNEESSVNFVARPVEGLMNCLPLKCDAVFARSLAWEATPGPIILGQSTPVDIDSSVTTSEFGRDSLSGPNLWRLGMFGSRNMDGSGDRIAEIQQVLGTAERALSYAAGETLVYEDMRAKFDLSSLGCDEYRFLCMEFSQAKRPDPVYDFFTEEGTPTLITCKEEQCRTALNLGPLTGQLNVGAIVDDRVENPIELVLEAEGGETGVIGNDLWIMTAWGSSNMDGGGQKFDLKEQVLSDEQGDLTLKPSKPLEIGQVNFNLDMTGIGCNDVRFMCVELSRDSAASVDFTVVPRPDENGLKTCFRLDCEGVFAERLDWEYTPQGPITIGQDVPLSIDAVAVAKSLKDISGTGLWKVNFFGSNDPKGEGKRVNSQEQLLSSPQQGLTLETAVGQLQFDGLSVQFDIGSVGCRGADVDHLCLEYGRGKAPDPNYYFFTESGAETLITCKRLDCTAEIEMKQLLAPLEDGKIVESEPTNALEFDVTAVATETSDGIVGEDLWQVTMFGSGDPNGFGTPISPQTQVLSRRQSSMNLEPGGQIEYGTVTVNFDMTEVSCSEITHICMRLQKSPSASIDYTLTAVPDESVLLDCSEVYCQGVTATALTWEYEATNVIINKAGTLTIDAEVSMLEDSRSLSGGSGFWRMGLYASQNADGSGEQLGYQSQILTGTEAATDFVQGTNLEFADVETSFDVAALGCGDYEYLCLEFTQGDEPVPEFKYNVQGRGDTDNMMLSSCVAVECNKDVVLVNLLATLADNGITEGQENRLVLESSALADSKSRGVAGEGLWALEAWVTPETDSDTKFAVQSQVLSSSQSDLTLKPGGSLMFGQVAYTHDLSEVTCENAQHLCVQLKKGPAPTADFNLKAVPSEDVLKVCNPLQCVGVIVTDFDWSYSATDMVPGKATPVEIDSSIIVSRKSRNLEGEGLWKISLFGSKTAAGDETDDRFGLVDQTLSPEQASTSLFKGSSMIINDIQTMFDIGSIGCTDYTYVCAEFTKGDDPLPEYSFSVGEPIPNGVPGLPAADFSGSAGSKTDTLKSCKKQKCNLKAIFTDTVTDVTGSEPLVEDRRSNPFVINFSGIPAEDANIIGGTSLWQADAFISSRASGSGRKYSLVKDVLEQPNQDISLDPIELLDFSAIAVDLNMRGLSCTDAQYICLTLKPNPDTSIEYTMIGRPGEEVLTDCVSMADRCIGVIATAIDWTYDAGEYSYGETANVDFDITVSTTEDSRVLNGIGLWRMGVFASTQADGSGYREAERTQMLSPYSSSIPLDPPTPLDYDVNRVRFDMNPLGCAAYRYLCVEFSKKVGSDPDFAFQTSTGGDALVSCKEVQCQSVVLTGQETTPDTIFLQEGEDSNMVVFTTVAQSAEDSSVVRRGLDLWTMAMYASSNAEGTGPQLNRQESVLSPYHASIPLLTPGGTITYPGVVAYFNMEDLRCRDVKYLCTELDKNPLRDFEFEARPGMEVLTDCFRIDNCRGLMITGLDWTLEAQKIKSNKPDTAVMDIDISSEEGASRVIGDRLWRVGVFGSKSPTGAGQRLGYKRQVFDKETAGTDMNPGYPMNFYQVTTDFDFTQLGCGSEWMYFCIEFAKGFQATPDFDVSYIDGGNSIIDCKIYECQRPVKVNDVSTVLLSQSNLLESSRFNRITYDLKAATTTDSGAAEGDGLWALTVYGSQSAFGAGPKYSPQSVYTLNRRQAAIAARGSGEPIKFGTVDVNFDMSNHVCTEIQYICSDLRKGSKPQPDFEFMAVPDESVLTDCMKINCEGVIVQNTRLDLSGRGELAEGVNEIEFDVTITSIGTGADARGNGLWKLKTFTTSDFTGKSDRNLMDEQTLTSSQASQDMLSGSRTTFRNLAARIDREQVTCGADSYICVELSRGDRPSKDFTMNPAYEDSYLSCERVLCAKTALPLPSAEKGEKGAKGEPARFEGSGIAGEPGDPGTPGLDWTAGGSGMVAGPQGQPGNPGPPGGSGPRGLTGASGPPGPGGPRGDNGNDGMPGLPGQPGNSGPPGPPGELVASASTGGGAKGPSSFPGYTYSNVAGAPGPRGPPGPPGSRGAQGMSGPPGQNGDTGTAGPGGPAGPPGQPGRTGTDGDKGQDGSPGSPGGRGTPGQRGPGGVPGRPGSKGHRGFNGAPGQTGETGAAGERGADGNPGEPGLQGNPGAIGPQGQRGRVGSSGDTGSRGAPGAPGSQGPSGQPGTTGAPGAPGLGGAKGDQGQAGGRGPAGLQGGRGSPGEPGATGSTGQTGAPGREGMSGAKGASGSAGAAGAPGMPGSQGAPGAQGNIGPVGQKGNQGSTGIMGQTGEQGPAGQRGETGTAGPQGEAGDNGERGSRGPVGPPGAVGLAGPRGPLGPSGQPGQPGAQGGKGEPGGKGLRGSPGQKGATGEGGRPGEPGVPGAKGNTGPPGKHGADGKPGPQGAPGGSGRDGAAGPAGQRGAPGAIGAPGQQGQSGQRGADGEAGPQGQPGNQGEAGKQGSPGGAGAPGAPGVAGDRGPAGQQGSAGPSGQPGGPGPQGDAGAQGEVGPAGDSGAQGPAGSPGQRGEVGSPGQTGSPGLGGRRGGPGRAGPQGSTGVPGEKGETGSAGSPGAQGAPGGRGSDGPSGPRGGPGEAGPRGAIGQPGADGDRGPMGSPGAQGQSGLPGDAGEPGDPGPNGAPGGRGDIGARGAPGGIGQPGFVGPAGAPGAQGVRGEPGDQGAVGQPGQAGPAGPIGADGAVGPQGIVGAAGERGVQGGPGAMGPSGQMGAPGQIGPAGPTGATGPAGPSGNDGQQGQTGEGGPQGRPGNTGPQGLPGQSGDSGDSGEPGRPGSAGQPGPPGPAGNSGPSGLSGQAGGRGAPGALGAPGEPGRTGPAGQNGEKGPPGPRGPAGNIGAIGETGADGSDGSPGQRGNPGQRGEKGDGGLPGPTGPIGPPGGLGATGASGQQGERGEVGQTGAPGTPGPAGQRGAAGPAGMAGPSGPSGERGETGARGFKGHSGQSGLPGSPGQIGPGGDPGAPGEPGGPGPRGPSGSRGGSGKDGSPGPRGFSGAVGARGPRGEAGQGGQPGSPGQPGPPGPPGNVEGLYAQGGYAASSGGDKGGGAYGYGRYQADAAPNDKEQVELTDTEIMAALESLNAQIVSMKMPTGTRSNPARTCKDLFLSHPTKESGMYFIDPNRGCREDAIEVFCNRQTSESCIMAQTPTTANATWYTGPSKHVYFGAMEGGSQFTYVNDAVQMTFLRLLTTQARQNLTYYCKNSVAVFDATAGNTDKSLKVMTSSEIELSVDGSSKFRYDVVEDGCHTHTGEWSKTVIEYVTNRNTRLPFIDVAPADIGSKKIDQEFGIDMGPACFV